MALKIHQSATNKCSNAVSNASVELMITPASYTFSMLKDQIQRCRDATLHVADQYLRALPDLGSEGAAGEGRGRACCAVSGRAAKDQARPHLVVRPCTLKAISDSLAMGLTSFLGNGDVACECATVARLGNLGQLASLQLCLSECIHRRPASAGLLLFSYLEIAQLHPVYCC